MSRIRLGHKPSDWRDEGPSTGRISATRYGIRGGSGNPIVVGSMITGIRPKSGARAQAEYKARKTTPRAQRTDYGWGLYAPEDER